MKTRTITDEELCAALLNSPFEQGLRAAGPPPLPREEEIAIEVDDTWITILEEVG